MAGWGFVHEKLDIKFLILYVAARVVEPVSFESMLELTMCDDGFGYFDFSDCLAELVETEHLALENDRYAITEKGRRNSRICESSLAYSVRVRADRALDAFNQKLKRQSLVKAALSQRSNGTYTVSLSLSDDVANLLSLELMVTQREMGERLCKRFSGGAEQLYGTLIHVLLDGEDAPPKTADGERTESGDSLQ